MLGFAVWDALCLGEGVVVTEAQRGDLLGLACCAAVASLCEDEWCTCRLV